MWTSTFGGSGQIGCMWTGGRGGQKASFCVDLINGWSLIFTTNQLNEFSTDQHSHLEWSYRALSIPLYTGRRRTSKKAPCWNWEDEDLIFQWEWRACFSKCFTINLNPAKCTLDQKILQQKFFKLERKQFFGHANKQISGHTNKVEAPRSKSEAQRIRSGSQYKNSKMLKNVYYNSTTKQHSRIQLDNNSIASEMALGIGMQSLGHLPLQNVLSFQ